MPQDDFLRLLLQSEREILRYVMAIVPNMQDAQEIVQETAVALWSRIDDYDPRRPFVPWACRFAANKAREHLRSQGRWAGFLSDDVATLLLSRREQLSPELDRRVEPLRDCLAALPADNRQLLTDYYYERSTIDEIADRRQRSTAALYKSLQRLRSALMDCIDGKLAAVEAT